MKNESSRVYYLSTLRESSIKRIKRIVFQSTSKTSMSQTKSPEEQKSAKFGQVACLNEDTCSSGTGAIACEQTLLFGRAKRVSRERASERRSREGPLARAFSRARQTGELARRLPMLMLISQGEPTPQRLSQNRTNLRKSAPGNDSGRRMRPTLRTWRCGKAVKMMSKIESILDK